MKIGPVIAFTTALAACSTGMSEGQFAASQSVIQNDPAARQTLLARCIRDQAMRAGAGQQYLANQMQVPLEDVPQTFCTRMVRGMQSGQLTAADLNSPVTGYTPNLMRIIRGG